jgi:FK506-binding protein 1
MTIKLFFISLYSPTEIIRRDNNVKNFINNKLQNKDYSNNKEIFLNKFNFLVKNLRRKHSSKLIFTNMCLNDDSVSSDKFEFLNASEVIEDITGDNGVLKEILKKGKGLKVQENSIVKINYKGCLENGEIFDNSFNQNEPYIFMIGQNKVIKGWEIAIRTMCEGEKAKITIAPEYGYKKKGIPPIIPPNAKLFFEIEVLEIAPQKQNNLEKINSELKNDIPRTPEKIAEDFEKKMFKKNKFEKKKEIEDFFFISFFQSQNGEKAPWWLNPNITFFLVFFTILALFYIVVLTGGIHQGYVE